MSSEQHKESETLMAAPASEPHPDLEMAVELEVEVDPSESASHLGQDSQQREKVEASGVVEESGAVGGNEGTQQ
jgi:hypothetical protein